MTSVEYLQRDDLTDDLVVIKINQLYKKGMSDLELYEVTRTAWRRTLGSVQGTEYCLAVSNSIVVEVYHIDTWAPAGTTPVTTRSLEPAHCVGRIEFTGTVADQNIRIKYIGKSVADLYMQGEADPLKVFQHDVHKLMNMEILNKAIADLPQYMKKNYNCDAVDFREGIFSGEEFKKPIASEVRSILDYKNWSEDLVGTGNIAERMYKAVGKAGILVDVHQQTSLRNCLDSSKQTPEKIKEAELALYHLYCGEDTLKTFKELVSIYSGHYDTIAFLYMIKDENRYMPIRTGTIDKNFKRLGINFQTGARCNWENYHLYNRIIEAIQKEMEKLLGVEVSMLDAHSFVWLADNFIAKNSGSSKVIIDINEPLLPKHIITQKDGTVIVTCGNCDSSFEKAPRCPECGQLIKY